ncbi:MAG: hypothetical protein R6V07_06250 [Armatimonadota bacterium]
MTEQRRLEPFKRGRQNRADGWRSVRASHPGVRDHRPISVADWPPLVNAAIIATCAFITAIAILSASMASPVGTVEDWNEWRADDGAISLEHPSGWAVRDVGPPEQTHVIILRSQWVRIHVISERALNVGAAHYGALEMIHRQTAETWQRQVFSDFEEGRMGRTTIGGKRAVWSQFKYQGRYLEAGEPMIGYRATIVGDNGGVIASAVAPSAHWQEFKPIALHVLRSIRFGDHGR